MFEAVSGILRNIFSNHDWLDELPQADKEALLALREGSNSVLSHPQNITYSLYGIRNKERAEIISKYISNYGWEVTIFEDPEYTGSYMIDARKEGYIISKNSYVKDTEFFSSIAEENGVEYEGWTVSK